MTQAMDYRYQSAQLRWQGWAIVLLLHLLLAWLLTTVAGREAPDPVTQPLRSVLIQDVVIAPPPPAAPATKPKGPEPRATVQATPATAPAVAAAPVAPSTPPQPASADPVQPVAPNPAAAATPAAPAALAAPARNEPAVPATRPVAATAAAPAARPPDKADISISCPVQVLPLTPRMAQRSGAQGVVRAQALIKDGVVKEVTILSGPPVFHAAVREAMLQYRCTANGAEVLAVQDFSFKGE